MKKYKIAQIGTFDVENYGDLLFPIVLKEKFPDFEIDIFSPKGGLKPFEKNMYVNPLDNLERMCIENKYDALIIGGGDLIRLDDKVSNIYKQSYETSLSIWQFPIILGKKYKIPVIFNCPGVPYYFKENQKKIIYQIMRNVDYLTVRDEESKHILETCGLKNIKVVPDTILCIDEIISKEQNIEMKLKLEKSKKIPKVDNYIAIQHNISNIDNVDYINELKKLINLIINKYNYNVLLIPIGYVHNDIDFLEKLYDKNNKNIYIVKNKLSPKEMLSIFACSKGYIGTSMHGAITTYAYGNPIMIINVKKLVKIGGLLDLIDKKNIEVNNIFSTIDIFEKYFFIENKNKRKEKKMIDKHFEKINSIVEKTNVINEYNYERDILTEVYNELSKYNSDVFDFASIYQDFGNGFSEDTKKIVRMNVDKNKIILECDLSLDLKQVRIDLIEGKIVKFKNLKIYLDDKETGYFIPNSNLIGEFNYICSLDPQIYVKTNDNKKLKLYLECYTVEYNEIDFFINKIIEQKNIIESQLFELKKSYKKTIRYYLQKFKNFIIKK